MKFSGKKNTMIELYKELEFITMLFFYSKDINV